MKLTPTNHKYSSGSNDLVKLVDWNSKNKVYNCYLKISWQIRESWHKFESLVIDDQNVLEKLPLQATILSLETNE